MNRIRLAAVAGLVVCLCALLVDPAAAQPMPPPHAFFGTVTVDDEAAPAGTIIEVRGAGVRTGIPANPLTTSFAGYYGGPTIREEKLIVQGQLGEGDALEFYINGTRAQVAEPSGAWQDTYPFQSLGITPLNLRLGGTRPSPPLSEILARPTPVLPAMTPTSPAIEVATAVPTFAATNGAPAPSATSGAPTPQSAAAATQMPPATLATPTATASLGSVPQAPAPGSDVTASQPTEPAADHPAASKPAKSPSGAPASVRATSQVRATKTPPVFAAMSEKSGTANSGSDTGGQQQALSTTSNGLGGVAVAVAGVGALLIAATLLLVWRRRQRSTTSAKEA